MAGEASEINGASYSEQLLEAARRDNTELLLTIKSELNNDQEKLAMLINSTKEAITGNTALHLACMLGNWDVIDIVLDIEGVEIDPLNNAQDTPLHLAVKYTYDEPEHGHFIIDNMLDAGSDPRIKDKDGLKPIDYVQQENTKLKELLGSAEYAISMEIPDDEALGQDNDADDSPSGSDSE